MDQLVITDSESKLNALWYTVLLWYVLIGSALFNVVYFIFGLITPNYDMMRQPIGELELVNHGWIQSLNLLQFALSAFGLGIILLKELRDGFGEKLIPVFKLVTAASFILMAVLIHEPAHTYVSLMAIATVLISFVMLSIRFTREPQWKGWATYTMSSALLMLVLLIAFWYLDNRNHSYAGIPERLIVVTRLVWVILFISKLLSGRKFIGSKALSH